MKIEATLVEIQEGFFVDPDAVAYAVEDMPHGNPSYTVPCGLAMANDTGPLHPLSTDFKTVVTGLNLMEVEGGLAINPRAITRMHVQAKTREENPTCVSVAFLKQTKVLHVEIDELVEMISKHNGSGFGSCPRGIIRLKDI